jgi:hypothetical protein
MKILLEHYLARNASGNNDDFHAVEGGVEFVGGVSVDLCKG